MNTCMELLTTEFFFQFVKYCKQAAYTFRNLVVFLLVYGCKCDVWREVSGGVVIYIFLIH